MLKIGASYAKNRLGSLLDRVEQGDEIVITRHGKPVARLTHIGNRIDRLQARAVAARIRERGVSLRTRFDWEAIKADQDAGRT